MGFIKKLFGPLSKSIDKITFFQQKAVIKANEISEGNRVRAPLYPDEEKILAKLKWENRDKLEEEINRKNDALIENMNKISIVSTNPVKQQAQRELPKRPWEYIHDNKMDYEYGFFEPPLEKMEKNRIMFREALELLRARMEVESQTKTEHDTHHAHDYMKLHPAVNRIDKEKLDRMWEYFRPFIQKKEQKIVQKTDLETIENYVEGVEKNIPHLQLERQKRLDIKARQIFPDTGELRQIQHPSKYDAAEYQFKVQEKRDESVRRLEQTLSKLDESTDNSKKTNN